jgi:membrane associated rhomboid family serine protease
MHAQPRPSRTDLVHRMPWLTTSVACVTACVSLVGFGAPSVRHALERQPGALGRGEAWRLVTSLLVHPDAVALIANLVLLFVVGTALEPRISRTEWIALYLGAGVLAQLPGIAWDPHDSGNSVAIFGLVGGLAVLAVQRRQIPLWSIGYAGFALVALLGMDVDPILGVVLWIAAAVAAGGVIRSSREHAVEAARLLGTVVVAQGVVLCLLADVHGPALLIGSLLALGWTRVGRTSTSTRG